MADCGCLYAFDILAVNATDAFDLGPLAVDLF